jgi:hypothetical protein
VLDTVTDRKSEQYRVYECKFLHSPLEFAILVTNERQGLMSVKVKADGIIAQMLALRPLEGQNVAFYEESLTVERPFIFARLDLVGMTSFKLLDLANSPLVDDDNLLDTSGYPHVGEIEIICEDFIGGKVSSSFKTDYKKPFVENKKVHERAKKGVGVHVG